MIDQSGTKNQLVTAIGQSDSEVLIDTDFKMASKTPGYSSRFSLRLLNLCWSGYNYFLIFHGLVQFDGRS